MVWDQVSDTWQANNADAIRRMITTSSINSTSAIAKLVTEKAYTDAGGRIERDLFTTDDTANWIDPEIVNRLAAEKIEAAAAKIAEETGLAWVRPLLDTRVNHVATEELHHYHMPSAPLTMEQQHARSRKAMKASTRTKRHSTTSTPAGKKQPTSTASSSIGRAMSPTK